MFFPGKCCRNGLRMRRKTPHLDFFPRPGPIWGARRIEWSQSEVTSMCFNNGNNNCSCLWLIIIVVLICCCCGSGNAFGGSSCGCGCGCGNDNCGNGCC